MTSYLLHARNRWLNSAMGRWLQRDPVGYVDGMNLYKHVRSNPVAYVDPFGLQEGGAAATEPADEPPTEVTVAVSAHGSRAGGEGAFDGRASKSGGGDYDTVDTGKELLDLLEEKSKNNCCIKTLAIHSHSNGHNVSMRWDSGFFQDGEAGVREPHADNPPANVGDAHTQVDGASRNVADLKQAIDDGKIEFCDGCVIKLFGCYQGGADGLAKALSQNTPCQVIAATGSSYPVNEAGERVGSDTTDTVEDQTEVGARSTAGFRRWENGVATEIAADETVDY